MPAKKKISIAVSSQLESILRDGNIDARSIVDFIVGPTCGLESSRKSDNATPFLMAVKEKRLDVVQQLLSEYSPNLQVVIADGRTALHLAAQHGNLPMVELLVERGGCDILALDDRGYAPFDRTARSRHKEIAECLLSKGIPPYALTSVACAGWTDMVSYLLAMAGENYLRTLNVTDSEGKTPLANAILSDHGDLALLLLELGADPNICDNEQSCPLHHVCLKDMPEVTRALVSKGALLEAVNSEGFSPLNYAIYGWQSNSALLLLELGADLCTHSTALETPLHMACGKGLIDVAKVLLAKGAATDALDINGNTPSYYACYQNNAKLVLLLLEHGASSMIGMN